MPAEIKYLDGGIGVLLKGKGLVTGQELINALKEIYSSEKIAENLKYSIVDFSGIESMKVSNSEIEIIVKIHEKAGKFSPDRVVAVAASRDLAFGLSRVWDANIYDSQWERIIVRTRDEAESWVKEKVKGKFSIDITLA